MLSSWHSKLARLARLSAFALTVQIIGLCWLGHSVHARANASLERIGEQALHYARAFHRAPTHTLSVNGLAFELSVGSSHDPVGSVLAAYRAQCRQWNAALPSMPHANAADLALQAETRERGYVACLDPGASLGPLAWAQRVSTFAQDLDLSRFGAVLYVVAERAGETTTYVAMKSVGPMPLTAAFPTSGDAPGVDPANAPRPAHARRVLSGWQRDASPLFNVYEARAVSSAQLLARYRTQLEAAGYHVANVVTRAQSSATASLAATRGSVVLLATASQGDGDRALLSVTPLR